MNKLSKILFLVLVPVLFLASCKTEETQNNNQNTNEGGKRLGYDEYYVAFTTSEITGLYARHRDSLAWVRSNLPQIGNVAHFFLNPGDKSLSDPHIRVDYLSRKMQGCSTSDSLVLWVRQQFIDGPVKGEILVDNEMITTMNGIKCPLIAVKLPERPGEDGGVKSEKWNAWAYTLSGDFYVGWVLTAYSDGQYNEGVEKMRKLVASYNTGDEEDAEDPFAWQYGLNTGSDNKTGGDLDIKIDKGPPED